MVNLLSIENDKKILNYRDEEGTPIWLYMRYHIFSYLVHVITSEGGIIEGARHYNYKSIICLLKSANWNFRQRVFDKSKHDLAFYTVYRGIQGENGFINQYIYDFAKLIKDDCFVIMHSPLDWKIKEMDAEYSMIYDMPNYVITSFLKSSKYDINQTVALMHYVLIKVHKCITIDISDAMAKKIINKTLIDLSRLEQHSKWFSNALVRNKSKLLVFVGGTDSRHYKLYKRLRKVGIRIADLQHGCFTSSNYSYNYGEELLKADDIQIAIPDYLLSFGAWWETQTNIPYKKIFEVGYPFRERYLCSNARKTNEIILVIGSRRITEQYIMLCENIKKIFPKRRIIFRPHPSERVETERITAKMKLHCEIDFTSDLYKTLCHTEIIISELSTVLFEAVNIVNKILVWRTEYSEYVMPECPFSYFRDMDELKGLIEGETKPVKTDSIWLSDWKSGFRKFYKEVINID